MFYDQCTIFIAATNKKSKTKNRALSKTSSSLILWYAAYKSLCAQSHTPQRQARTVLKTSTDNHFSSFHINCSGRAKPDIISTWWAFYFTLSGYEWPKGLITLAIALYGSDQLIGSFLGNIEPSYGLSTYFPFSLAFYCAIILTTRRSLCTLQLYHLQDGDRGLCFQHGGVATNGDVSARNRFLFPVKVNNCWNVQRWLERRCGRSARKKRIVL